MDASGGFGEIARASRFVFDAVCARVEAKRASDVTTLSTPLGASAVEFDDVRYAVNTLSGDKDGDALEVSVGAPKGAWDAARGRADVEALVASAGTISVNETPSAGYDVTVRVDVKALAAIDEEDKRTMIARRVAMVRCAAYGTKLRSHLRSLWETGGVEGSLDWFERRPGEVMFIKPQSEQVTVIFPMRFSNSHDAVIATQFLTQFAEVRRGQKELSTAPAVSYLKAAPLELKESPDGMKRALDANGGYISFVLFKRHVSADRLEDTVWNIMTFPAFVSYHIKYSKAYWHSRMRSKVESWLSILKRAKKVDPNGKKMTTASGRTFIRK